MFQELRYAVQTLKASPSFTAIVLVTLALGVGAKTKATDQHGATKTCGGCALARDIDRESHDHKRFVGCGSRSRSWLSRSMCRPVWAGSRLYAHGPVALRPSVAPCGPVVSGCSVALAELEMR